MPITYKLYDFKFSGNSYKIRLILHQLKIQYELIPVDIIKGESRTPIFLKKNPSGRIPLLEITDNDSEKTRFISESNAILIFLSQNTQFFPKNKYHQAEVFEWLFWEQYSHEPNIASIRYWLCYNIEHNKEVLKQKYVLGYQAFDKLEQHLNGTVDGEEKLFLVANTYSIADIALYAYTHSAHEVVTITIKTK
eukprot:Pgem_evm2s506